MYLFTLLTYLALVVIEILFIMFFNLSIMNYGSIVIWMAFYSFYKRDIKRKINKIKLRHSQASEAELVQLSGEKGGTSWLAATLVIIFIIAVTILSTL